ncbi:thioredoxin domain-containing protein [Turicibacter sp. TJ11]|uniref:thioredoxin domain-containing protein n=1 Tax=Turicibacter sp. TJ11 TaxID=2806443 RepID=UPI001F2676FD|nr:thioredoxin domain-containing protein [Turicibacter sp. TJ11]
MSQNKKPNHLIHELSPYLLQHAYNPVNWYPWSEEAFAKAKTEDKPIFLSIGYSTCHWCHVMEDESFEDEEVAAYLNEYFVSIKVDREERPDIDSVYMTVCQSLTGQGGWPLTILMTPEGHPFYAGTYFPKQSRYGRPGLMDILKSLIKTWQNHREKIEEVSSDIQAHLTDLSTHISSQTELSPTLFKNALQHFKAIYDFEFGGFGEAPKFPTPHRLMYLLRTDDEEAIEMVKKTLDQMYKGGLFDHIGYGFSRYSTDEAWLVPHFEKMLYDNALLIMTYLEAYEVTKEKRYLMIATKTLDYVLRNLHHQEGGFYCAEDADSEGEEGKYYLFTDEEIIKLLGKEQGEFFNHYYNVTSEGNFEGKTILNRLHTSIELDEEKIEPLREKVLAYRASRYHLHKDDKILTSWNGLMLVALAKAYRVTQEEKYESLIHETITFINENLLDQGRLLARFREGKSHFLGYLDDYAFYVYGLIESYQSTFNTDYLSLAIKLTRDMIELFKDVEAGGYYLYGKDAETLMIRPKETYDGAMPSGNSVAAYNLIRLARLTGDVDLEKEAMEQLQFMATHATHYEISHAFYLIAAKFAIESSQELIAVLPQAQMLNDFKSFLSTNPLFHLTVVVKTKENELELNQLIPYLSNYAYSSQPAFYVCEGGSCRQPIHDLNQLNEVFKKKA